MKNDQTVIKIPAVDPNRSKYGQKSLIQQEFERMPEKGKCSEHFHQKELRHFSFKFNRNVFKKNPAEYAEVIKRMRTFANKNHTPVGFNTNF